MNTKVTQEGGSNGTRPSDAEKVELIAGVSNLLTDVRGKDPSTTFVVVDEVPLRK